MDFDPEAVGKRFAEAAEKALDEAATKSAQESVERAMALLDRSKSQWQSFIEHVGNAIKDTKLEGNALDIFVDD